MKQLVLDIAPPAPATLDNFMPGRNAELMQALHALIGGAEPQLYLWGAPGSGRSHLLRAAVAAARDRGLDAACVDAANFAAATTLPGDLLALDDVEALEADAQIRLFNCLNEVRAGRGRLLVAGMAAPAQLDLRMDVTTRLGWGLVYQVQVLTDAEKIQALTAYATARGFRLQAGVAEYLLRHWRRDLPSLLAALDTLDRYSLETQRPVTVPLLREILHAA